MTHHYGPNMGRPAPGAGSAGRQPGVPSPTPMPVAVRVSPQPPQPPRPGVRPAATQSAYQRVDQMYEKHTRRGGAWRVVFFVALFVFVCALACLGYIAFTYLNGQSEYEELNESVFEVDESDVYTLGSFHVDWDALRLMNRDIVGWVYVPGMNISYPIVWRENDSTYYLTHSFSNSTAGPLGAEYGCVMLEGINSGDWTDEVNVVYGHHMNNGTMFAPLAQFNYNSELFNQHRTFFVLTPGGNFRMTSFAVNYVDAGNTDIVIPNFETKREMAEYVKARYDQSTVVPDPPGPTPSNIHQVFAFSTCGAWNDNSSRIVTFCTVDEYLPAGSNEALSDSLVSKDDVDSVAAAVGERVQ